MVLQRNALFFSTLNHILKRFRSLTDFNETPFKIKTKYCRISHNFLYPVKGRKFEKHLSQGACNIRGNRRRPILKSSRRFSFSRKK